MFVCSVQIISRSDNQSKFQMFTPFPCRHIGVPKLYTNMAAPYWACDIDRHVATAYCDEVDLLHVTFEAGFPAVIGWF